MMPSESNSIGEWKAAMAVNLESMDQMTRNLRAQTAQIAAGEFAPERLLKLAGFDEDVPMAALLLRPVTPTARR